MEVMLVNLTVVLEEWMGGWEDGQLCMNGVKSAVLRTQPCGTPRFSVGDVRFPMPTFCSL